MRRSLRVLAGIALLSSWLVIAPEEALANGGAGIGQGRVTLNPPLDNTPGNSGTYSFVSTTIRILSGQHAGLYKVTSSGTRAASETCRTGSGSGTFKSTSGPWKLTGTVKFTRVSSVVLVNGLAKFTKGTTVHNHRYNIVLQFTPDLGQNCFVTPVRSARLDGAGQFT